jgi:hypothetical protein
MSYNDLKYAYEQELITIKYLQQELDETYEKLRTIIEFIKEYDSE